MLDLAKELRVMHACEVGAVGVYRGHKCVARYVFRSSVSTLDAMRSHERSHAEIFSQILCARGYRKCYFAGAWFFGGLIYGVIIGLLGIRAIGESTAAIERVVETELGLVLAKLKGEPELSKTIGQIQLEEMGHREHGNAFSEERNSVVTRIAVSAAYAAKFLAERM